MAATITAITRPQLRPSVWANLSRIRDMELRKGWQDKFDRLLKAMSEGELHKAGKSQPKAETTIIRLILRTRNRPQREWALALCLKRHC